MSKVKVKIPATTANMGPGFDALGMALKLYNEIEVEEVNGETEIYNDGIKAEESYESNLIYQSIVKTLDKFNYKYYGFIINVSKCDIPMCRGLGSSAACIVGGVTAANGIMKNKMSMDDIIEMSTDIEGHPDNVVPAALGGMVVSLKHGEKVSYSKIAVPDKLKFIAMIPSFKVSTEVSRKVMPETYLKEDCVFNISRVAMLVSALYNGELDKLRVCFGDKIHQPYRKTLIKNTEQVFNMAKKFGSIGEFISGSGSTLMAVVDKNQEEFESNMRKFLGSFEDEWKVIALDPDLDGVKAV